jgi:hypothetical protein
MADAYNPDLSQPVDAPIQRSGARERVVDDGASPSPAEAQGRPGVEYIEVEDFDEDDEDEGETAPAELTDASESAAPENDADDEADDEDDLEALPEWAREKIKRADEWDAWAAEAEASRQTYELEQHDSETIQNYESWLGGQIQYWHGVAERQPDPDAAKRNVDAWAANHYAKWHRDFAKSQRDRDRKLMAQAQHLLRAQELCAKLGLPQAAANDLVRYPAHLIEGEAVRMKRDRDREAQLKRQATTNARKAKRSELARTTPSATGTGRAAPRRVEAGSTDHYLLLEQRQPLRAARRR